MVSWQRSAGGPHLDPATLDALDRANANHPTPAPEAVSLVPVSSLYPPRATRETLQHIDATLDEAETDALV